MYQCRLDVTYGRNTRIVYDEQTSQDTELTHDSNDSKTHPSTPNIRLQ